MCVTVFASYSSFFFFQSKVRSLANLAAASATCQPAVAARRSQAARRGAHPPQNAGVHLRPRLRPAHGRLPTRAT